MAPARSQVEKARKFLTGGAVLREDSDDELGYDDHPWEWIYEDGRSDAHEQNATPRKRKAAPTPLGKRIIGARMGSFKCEVGDAVLLKAEGNQAWVGIICDFHEDVEEDEKMAKFLWFSSEKEIRNQNKKRTDFLPASHLTLSLTKHALTTARTNSTYQLLTTKIPSSQSMALPRSCHLSSTKSSIRQVSKNPRRTMARSSSAGEGATPGRRHTHPNLDGRTFSMGPTISSH